MNLKLEQRKAFFEKEYPSHNFDWKTVNNGFTGLCPEHDDHNASFGIFEKDGKVYSNCLACHFDFYSKFRDKLVPAENNIFQKIYDYLKTEITKKDSKPAYEYLNSRLPFFSPNNFYKEIYDNVFQKFDIAYLNKAIFTRLSAVLAEEQDFNDVILKNKNFGNIKTKMNLDLSGYLLFFYRNAFGKIRQIKFRRIHDGAHYRSKHDSETFRIISSPDNKKDEILFFNINNIHAEIIKEIVVVEGEFDALTPTLSANMDENHINIVSVSGTSGFNNKYADALLSRYKDVVITFAPDNDDAGGKSIKSLSPNKRVMVLQYDNDEYKDLDELTVKCGYKKINELLRADIKKEYVLGEEIIQANRPEVLAKLYKEELLRVNSNEIYTVKEIFNVEGEQEFVCGFPCGQVSIGVGQGGTGKTFIALKVGFDAAIQNKKVLIWLTEDTKYQIRDRIKFLKNTYDYDFEKIKDIKIRLDFPSAILEKTSANGIKKIDKALLEFQERIKGFDFIILDPLMNFQNENNNDNTYNRAFLNLIKTCLTEKQACLILHHTNKLVVELPDASSIANKRLTYNEIEERKAKIKGAAAIEETARHVSYIETNPILEHERIMSVIKSNVSRTGDIIHDVKLPCMLQDERLANKNYEENTKTTFETF